MNKELTQVLNQLGALENGEYKLHPFHKNSLYQLKRFLAADVDKSVFLRCSEINIIENDLLPMIKLFQNSNHDLLLIIIKICIILITPSSKVFNNMDSNDSEKSVLVVKREQYLANIYKSISNSDVLNSLNTSLENIFNESEKSDISLAVKEDIYNFVQLITIINPKGMSPSIKAMTKNSLLVQMLKSNIFETIYKYSKSSGRKADMNMFITILGQMLKGIDPRNVVASEAARRKDAERIKKMPLGERIKELAKSIVKNKTNTTVSKPPPPENDPLLSIIESANRRNSDSRYRGLMNGRFAGTFVDKNNLTSAGKAKIIHKVVSNPMDSILTHNSLKSSHRKIKNKSTVGNDIISYSLDDEMNIKLYQLIKMLIFSGFDFKLVAYSDILSWGSIKIELNGSEINYLYLQWFMLKMTRIDSMPWLFQNEFMSFYNIESWTERIFDTINNYDTTRLYYVKESFKHMVLLIEEALCRIPKLKERNNNEYKEIVDNLYFHDFLRSFTKFFQYTDNKLSSKSVYNALFSLVSTYFKVARFINISGGYCEEDGDTSEEKKGEVDILNLMGQFYNKHVSRGVIHYVGNYIEHVSPDEVHNLITVIYYSTFKFRKADFYCQISFFINLRKWISNIKATRMDSKILPVIEHLFRRFMLITERNHLYGINDSVYINVISKAKKSRKKKNKSFKDKNDRAEHFYELEDYNSENDEDFERDDYESNDEKDEINEEENDQLNEVDTEENKVNDDHNSEKSNESEDETECNEDDDEEWNDRPKMIRAESLIHIYTNKRGMFDGSDEEENDEKISNIPVKKRRLLSDDEDED
uniref:TIMELESS domain-containing protein n=1 Tax=Parastrongyloides trichosuri TaxID=131310 RepID=A0A0N4ZSE2_PARTI